MKIDDELTAMAISIIAFTTLGIILIALISSPIFQNLWGKL